MTAENAIAEIAASITRRPSPPSEIEQAVEKVFKTEIKSRGVSRFRMVRPKPTFKPDMLAGMATKIIGDAREMLCAKSPIRPHTRTVASFLHALYRPGENVLLFDKFQSQGCKVAERPGDIEPYDARCLNFMQQPKRGEGAWFLANPVTGEWTYQDRLKKSEHNPEGKSRRAEECVTSFRYLVLESDTAPPNQWLAALVQIPLPIASVATSGGKSIHALIRVDAESGDHWREIKEQIAAPLVALGADIAAMTAVRLTRLPCCYRAEKSRWQELLFLNPNPSATPICEMPNV